MINDEIGQQMSVKTCIHVVEVCLEGSVSQNSDIGPSFCFMLYRRWNFEKKRDKITKVCHFL